MLATSQIKQVNHSYSAQGKTREQLARQNLRLVHRAVHGFRALGFFQGEDGYKDGFAVGSLGLAKAIAKFDPVRARFSSFAVPYIEGEISHYLRDRLALVKVPSAWRAAYQKARHLSDREAAAKLDIPISRWGEIKIACSSYAVSEISDSVTYDEGSDRKAMHEAIRKSLGRIPNPYRSVLSDSFVHGLTNEQIAKKRSLELAVVQGLIEAGLARVKKHYLAGTTHD